MSKIIEDWFIETPIDRIDELRMECEAGLTSKGKVTQRIITAFNLKKWVSNLSNDFGFVPSTSDVAAKFEAMSPTPNLDELGQELSRRSDLALLRNRKFFWKFRKRWVIKLGKISAKKMPTASHMAAQACHGSTGTMGGGMTGRGLDQSAYPTFQPHNLTFKLASRFRLF